LGCAVHTGSTRHCGHYWAIVPASGECKDGEVGGMNGFGRGNRSTRRKPAPTPLCPPQIHLPDPGANTGRRGGKPATNRSLFIPVIPVSLLQRSSFLPHKTTGIAATL
jgi:hypothetical protein